VSWGFEVSKNINPVFEPLTMSKLLRFRFALLTFVLVLLWAILLNSL